MAACRMPGNARGWRHYSPDNAMLVRFTCEAYRDVLLFGDIAQALLAMMGHSGTTPGALATAEVRPALARLREALPAGHQPPAPATDQAPDQADSEAEDDPPTPIPLTTRALPLIELLTAADKAEAPVLWYPA